MRIDMHAHFMPPELAGDRAFFEREPFWEYLVEPEPGKKSVQGWATPERMLNDMDLAGIDRVVLQGEYFLQHASAVERNDRVLDLVHRRPDRVMAFAALQPKAGAAALDEFKRCLDGGMCGVGELSPYAQGYRMDDADFLRIAEACIDAGIPLLVHANEEVGRHYRGKVPVPLAHYYELACRYPELKLILAHWGGGLCFNEIMPEAKKALANVWYDTAASPLVHATAKIFQMALACAGPAKILYASDYPLLLYPRHHSEPDFMPFITEIDQLGLDPPTYERIMGGNAAQLLGLVESRPNLAAPNKVHDMAPVPRAERTEIHAGMAVRWIAHAFPETRAVLDHYQLAWQDSGVAFSEPLVQAACARGLGAVERRRLLEDLNAAVSAPSGASDL